MWGTPLNPLQSRRWGNAAVWAQTNLLVKKPVPFRGNNHATSDWLVFPPVQMGELIGIKPEDRNLNLHNYYPMISFLTAANIFHDSVSSEAASTVVGMSTNFNLFSHNGGGIFGLNSNMIMNWGHEPGRLSDGALKLPRRWIFNTMNSLLCTAFPVLRETDVTSFVDSSTDISNVAEFRRGVNCVQCHATMDQMASVGRNFLVSYSDYDYKKDTSNNYGKHILLMGRFTSSVATNYSWSSTPVPDFHKQTPRGRVFFRSINGQLIDQQVEGLGEMGEVLSATDDLYQCAAKRYFQYFTGHDVKLYDRGDPRYATYTLSLKNQDLEKRKFIQSLGKELKSHQNARTIIKKIISSPYYKDEHYEP